MKHDEKDGAAPRAHGKHKYGPEYVTRELQITGIVSKPLRLRVADLMRMPSVAVEDLTLVCGSGTEKETIGSYRGVLLREVLQQADVIITEHHAPNRIYLKLSSNDGYVAIFSWQEINNTQVGEKAIIVFEKDGQPLGDDEGEFAFVSANDYRPGPRRMRYLRHIEVCEIT